MLDFVLICFGWGSPGAASVFMPASRGLYTRFSALLIVLVPICSLFWNRKHDLGIRLDRPTWPPGLSAVLNLLATLVALVLISFWFLEASTTPITAWDANISWDKWATEWAHRSNSYRYVTGAIRSCFQHSYRFFTNCRALRHSVAASSNMRPMHSTPLRQECCWWP